MVHWDDIIGLCMQINHLFIFPLTFGVLTAFITVQEYQTEAVINLFILPLAEQLLSCPKQ
ncbi:hypothetical protein EIZ39_09050 [Ammoniphilus sp. CFH 90114]|nr:hypothetical protein EIZ39_09050 [Ammoniphilus sp. CFH 90114]